MGLQQELELKLVMAKFFRDLARVTPEGQAPDTEAVEALEKIINGYNQELWAMYPYGTGAQGTNSK